MSKSINIGPKLTGFLAEKIVSAIRKEYFEILSSFSDEILSNYKLVDEIRKSLNKTDIDRLLKIYNTEYRDLQGLYITLMKKYINDGRTFNFLKEKWKESEDFSEKNRIMYRLIEADEFVNDNDLFFEFYKFINQNWGKFLSSVKFRCNGEENVMEYVNSRLEDSKFPTRKNWIYLYCSFASENKDKILKLLKQYESYNSPIQGLDIAGELIKKIENNINLEEK